jgi:hypothetical protein
LSSSPSTAKKRPVESNTSFIQLLKILNVFSNNDGFYVLLIYLKMINIKNNPNINKGKSAKDSFLLRTMLLFIFEKGPN